MSVRKGIITWVVTGVALTGLGCASGGNGGGEAAASSSAATQPAQPAKPDYTAPPAGSKLARVTAGMSDEQVRTIMGAPDHTNSYMTGKAWIPYNFGAGDKTRSDWIYQGQGRVVFTQNQWSGRLSVLKVLYNPNELK